VHAKPAGAFDVGLNIPTGDDKICRQKQVYLGRYVSHSTYAKVRSTTPSARRRWYASPMRNSTSIIVEWASVAISQNYSLRIPTVVVYGLLCTRNYNFSEQPAVKPGWCLLSVERYAR